MEELRITVATSADAADIAAIYAPYVQDTAITFEYEAPSAQEMAERIERITATHPWLVARDAVGSVLGYAYASPYYGRAAYAWCVETSIYVDRSVRGRGVGSALYQELERALSAQDILNLYACIATTNVPDAHLDNGSVAFHERRGYHDIGRFQLRLQVWALVRHGVDGARPGRAHPGAAQRAAVPAGKVPARPIGHSRAPWQQRSPHLRKGRRTAPQTWQDRLGSRRARKHAQTRRAG